VINLTFPNEKEERNKNRNLMRKRRNRWIKTDLAQQGDKETTTNDIQNINRPQTPKKIL